MDSLAYQDDVWDELLDGKAVAMSPRPLMNHGRVANNITRIFETYLLGKTCQFFGEHDVFLTEKDRVIPDAMVVCNPEILRRNGVYGAPDMIFEILSLGTAKRDRGYKKDLYERCGVKEYWIIDADNRTVEAYLLQNGRYGLDDVYMLFYNEVIEQMSDEEKELLKYEIKPSLFPELVIPLEDIFRGMLL